MITKAKRKPIRHAPPLNATNTSYQTDDPSVLLWDLVLNCSIHNLMHRSISLWLLLNVTLLCRHKPMSCLYARRRRRDRHALVASILYFLTVHTRCRTRVVNARAYLVASLDVHVFDVKGVDMTGKVAQDCEE